MKKTVSVLLALLTGAAGYASGSTVNGPEPAEDTGHKVVFDFSAPETLTPPLAAPAVKDFVLLDGCSFTSGDVEVSFAATGGGNTAVRLFGSYDAGTNVRIYDGDTMTVRTLDPTHFISGISVTIPLGQSSDAWFIPSSGEWIWEEDRWEPEAAEPAAEVELVSYQQSRIATLTVTLEKLSGIVGVEDSCAVGDCEIRYYDLQGNRVVNPGKGLCIRVSPGKTEKIFLR